MTDPENGNLRRVAAELSAPGVSPERIERDFLLPVERRLMFVEGVRGITAIASEGSGRLEVQTEPFADLAAILAAVHEAVRRIKPLLPDKARTLVERVDEDA